MSKWTILPAALVVFALNANASADWFDSVGRYGNSAVGRPMLTSAGGGSVVIQNGGGKGVMSHAAPYGYPFYSSCCEPRHSCCGDLWSGFCAQARCMHHRMKGWGGCGGCRPMRMHRSPCGCGTPSCGGCSGGKGAVVGGKGYGGNCGSPCGSSGFRLGLFDWLHSGFGCGSCGSAWHGNAGCGCGGTVSHGKGTSSYYHKGSPTIETGPTIHIPGDTPAPMTPPTPEPVSTQSAGKWWAPKRFLPLK